MKLTERVTAVEKPMQYSVPETSLSMVFGTPITATPSSCRRPANDSVPSPPIAISASISRNSSTSRAAPVRSWQPAASALPARSRRRSGTLSSFISAGLMREV
jgi:hypothetical protein